MNYYIQGDAAKADKIRAAFESKEIRVPHYRSCGDNSLIYFSLNKEVLAVTIKALELFEDNPDYKELELPVEPKFKVGDWIVRNNGSSDVPIQVYGLKKDRYLVTNMLGSKGQVMINRQDEWHLWTIQDAKEGDVLVDEYNNIGLYSGEKDDLYWHSCIYFGCDEYLRGSRGYHKHKNTKPATKEQRDLLFSKMKELGYEWDAENKLRKIKPHYDIKNFHAGMPVLVRDDDDEEWNYLFFSHYRKKLSDHFFAGGNPWFQCIPFVEDTKRLLGTTDMCDEMYVNW